MTAIRDLSAVEFEQRYGCDRFTATVLTNRFGYVVEHMCARLLTSAFSPMLSASICGPHTRPPFALSSAGLVTRMRCHGDLPSWC